MARLIPFFAVFLLAPQFLFAQNDFREGFIVTTQRDTVFLKIDYRGRSKHYESCRTINGGVVKEYGPDQLLSYGFINDRYFESGIAEGSFVEVLVRGEMSLYRHGDSFYAKKDDKLYHLEEKVIKHHSGVRMKADQRWKGLLATMISDCIQDQEALKALRFHEKPITDLTTRYNTCRQSRFTVYKATKPWTKVELGVAFGMTQSTLVIHNYLYNIPFLKDRYHSLNPTIGLITSISSPRVSERIALQPEVHVLQGSYSSTVVTQTPDYTLRGDVYINVTTISVPVLLRYSFPERKYFPQLTVGINLDSHVKSESRFVHEVVTDGVSNTADEEGFQINKNHFGYLAGLGVMRLFPKFKAGLMFRCIWMGRMSGSLGLHARNEKLSLSAIVQMK